MKNIILTGFMGCGKTSVGTRLSCKTGRNMTDTDSLIEKSYKMTVSEIFKRFGEEEFRQAETRCLEKLIRETEGQIISVGGGLPIRQENRKLLKRLGNVIYLRVTPETVCTRLAADTTRPLLQGENPQEKVKELLKMRAPVYESMADLIIDTDGKEIDVIADEILERTGRKGEITGN